MPSHKDEWVKLAPPDEFSLDNPVNTTNSRRNRLVRLNKDNPLFTQVEQLFVKGWRHRKKARPDVQYIFKVLWPEPTLEPYLDYRDQVQAALKAKDKRGNERLLFHGTNRACLLGDSSASVLLCGLKECYLCSILRNSFDVSKCGSKNSFKRYVSLCLEASQSESGSDSDMVYIPQPAPRVRPLSLPEPNPSSWITEADDYITNVSESASLRVMMVSRVVVGRPYKRYRNAPDMVAPPPGYDSIAGEIGWDLNYEETVTYHNDTIRPAYLVVYGDKPRLPNLKTFVQRVFKTPLVS